MPKYNPLIGEPAPGEGAIKQMRDQGGDWFAYQNHDLGHPGIGHLRFLKAGPGCTFVEPPAKYPDTPQAIGWRYVIVGKVNLATGKIDTKEAS